MIEQCHDSKAHSIILLALDWAKAFDAIDPSSLVHALKRFGLPDQFLHAIQVTYSQRKFFVNDCGYESQMHDQHNGISQGCPLSPYLFVMLMTVMMYDAKAQLASEYKVTLSPELVCHECIYADDTLLIEVVGEHLQAYMNCIAACGKEYGLQLN